jgi:predicted aconitase with swiveling domain
MNGRGIVDGFGAGEALVSRQAVSFFGGVDARNGLVIEHGHELEGQSVSGKVLVFPRGKGSTVGSYVIYGLRKYGVAPAAIVNIETEPIIIAGCVLAGIPLVDRLDRSPVEVISSGDWVEVAGDTGTVWVTKTRLSGNEPS